MIRRAMARLTWSLNYVLAGMDPWGYHEALPAEARSLGEGSRP